MKALLSFTGGKGCKAEGIDPRKGLWIIGGTGVGKSTLMYTMQRMFKNTPRRSTSVRKAHLKDLWQSEGFTEISRRYGRGLKSDLYIDDVDPQDLSRTSETSIFSEIIIERNNLFNSEGFKTHLTTYVRWEEHTTVDVHSFNDIIKEDVLDRIHQMANLIVWEGPSLRNKDQVTDNSYNERQKNL